MSTKLTPLEKILHAKIVNTKDDSLAKEDEWQRHAIEIYCDFIADVEKGTLRNDGSSKLLNIIDKYVLQKETFHRTIQTETILYRARIIDEDTVSPDKGFTTKYGKITGYDETNSREAPLGFATEGRNNIQGAAYMYLSEKIGTACAEIKPRMSQLISVATFQVKQPIVVIDFVSQYTFDIK